MSQHLMDAKDLLRIAKTIEWNPDDTEQQYYFIQALNVLCDRAWSTEPIIAMWNKVPWALRNSIGFAITEVVDQIKNLANDFTVFAYDLENQLGWPHPGEKRK